MSNPNTPLNASEKRKAIIEKQAKLKEWLKTCDDLIDIANQEEDEIQKTLGDAINLKNKKVQALMDEIRKESNEVFSIHATLKPIVEELINLLEELKKLPLRKRKRSLGNEDNPSQKVAKNIQEIQKVFENHLGKKSNIYEYEGVSNLEAKALDKLDYATTAKNLQGATIQKKIKLLQKYLEEIKILQPIKPSDFKYW